MSSPIIIHIPHSLAVIPPHEVAKLFISGDALSQELLRMTDWHTDELFQVGEKTGTRLLLPVSRLVCAPERFPMTPTNRWQPKEWEPSTRGRPTDGRCAPVWS